MKAVVVRKEEAEAVRKNLLYEGVLDKTRRIVEKKALVEIPVTENFLKNDFMVVEQEMPHFYNPKRTLRELLDIPEHEKKLLPGGWHIIGDIVTISLCDEVENRKKEIANALLSLYPRCKTVLLDKGISGKTRQPRMEILAGEKTETIHSENGCHFKLDAMRVMYSQGNLYEKMRMSKKGKGETVVDMFAGIGYFSIPMAVHSKPKKILAIEINPVAFGYLSENIRLNRVGDIVEPLLGDCAVATPCGAADRVIMGYLDAYRYLEHGVNALLPGGIIHFHEAVPEAIEHRPVDRIIESAGRLGRGVQILGTRRIKKYSPGVWHVVVDARIF